MSTTELALTHADYEAAAGAEVARFMPVMKMEQAIQRREVIVQAFSKLMKDGEDFGKIPGGKKPTLLQPGAQKLDNLFGLVPRFIIDDREEDWTGERHAGEPFFRYLVKCQLFRGDFLMGEAIGECNSWESKYRYRSTDRSCPDCGQATILWTKKGSWWCNKHRGGCGKGFTKDDTRITSQQTGRTPNPEIFDQVNTLVKMAQKRAHVAATINATSASEFFTQDLEDRTPEASEPESPAPSGGQGDGPRPEQSGAPTNSGGNPARPVPEELVLMFENLDKDPKHTAAAFKMLETGLLELGGANGVTAYQEHVLELRAKYPKGTAIPMSAIKDCLLDLFATMQTIKPPEEFQATEADLPEILQEKK